MGCTNSKGEILSSVESQDESSSNFSPAEIREMAVRTSEDIYSGTYTVEQTFTNFIDSPDEATRKNRILKDNKNLEFQEFKNDEYVVNGYMEFVSGGAFIYSEKNGEWTKEKLYDSDQTLEATKNMSAFYSRFVIKEMLNTNSNTTWTYDNNIVTGVGSPMNFDRMECTIMIERDDQKLLNISLEFGEEDPSLHSYYTFVFTNWNDTHVTLPEARTINEA